MKSKVTVLFFGLVLIPCVILAQGPPNVVSVFEEQFDALLNATVVCPPGTPTRFVDNGDGTICDQETGLMWEKKDAADLVPDLDNPRDVDNTYTWTSNDGNITDPDGTVFTDFLPRLNGEIAGTGPSEQLGGHSDWRLPTSAELQTILDCNFGNPCIDPAFFTPTAASFYWTSTSNAVNPIFAWSVNFDTGAPVSGFKTNAGIVRARAVRGGQ